VIPLLSHLEPASSQAVAVQCAVLGSAHTSACAPGFKTRWTASARACIHAHHCHRPPFS
jgi:hypothetical protein